MINAEPAALGDAAGRKSDSSSVHTGGAPVRSNSDVGDELRHERMVNEHVSGRLFRWKSFFDVDQSPVVAALIELAPNDLEFTEIPIGNLPLYSPDYDENYPPEATALKEAIARSDAVLFVTPEYNRSIPGALKNAIDWASRPWGQNSFDHIPAAVIGASIGQIGTALAQQSLRGVLSYCNARQMTAPEAYIQYSPDVFTDDLPMLRTADRHRRRRIIR